MKSLRYHQKKQFIYNLKNVDESVREQQLQAGNGACLVVLRINIDGESVQDKNGRKVIDREKTVFIRVMKNLA